MGRSNKFKILSIFLGALLISCSSVNEGTYGETAPIESPQIIENTRKVEDEEKPQIEEEIKKQKELENQERAKKEAELEA